MQQFFTSYHPEVILKWSWIDSIASWTVYPLHCSYTGFMRNSYESIQISFSTSAESWRFFLFTFARIIFERNLRTADELKIASANAKNRNQINLSKSWNRNGTSNSLIARLRIQREKTRKILCCVALTSFSTDDTNTKRLELINFRVFSVVMRRGGILFLRLRVQLRFSPHAFWWTFSKCNCEERVIRSCISKI